MARLGRYFLGGQALHLIQRGSNRQPIFFPDDDYGLYREWAGNLTLTPDFLCSASSANPPRPPR
jgi:hypothetical protein